MNLNELSKYFSDSLTFLDEYKWLFQYPVVEILTKNTLESIPDDWKYFLKDLSNEELNNFVLGNLNKNNIPITLKSFIQNCKILNKLPKIIDLNLPNLPKSFTIGLSVKKQQEILHLAELIHQKCCQNQIKTIVDLGAGLGYICQILYHLYRYNILGLESNEKNVKKAKERQVSVYPESKGSVEYASIRITNDSVTQIGKLLFELTGNPNEEICLIGLHSCGDLSFNACKLFTSISNAKLLVMISCCYHKLEIDDRKTFNNFPASQTLKENINLHYGNDVEKIVSNPFGRPFLRLACQEPAVRWENMSEKSHETHARCVLFRAVLELCVQQNNICLKKCVQKGTRVSQCSDFETYLVSMVNRYTFNGEKCRDGLKDKMRDLWNEHKHNEDLVEIYSGLQLLLQASVESLVLHDRLCWLLEQNYYAKIITVISNKISPRCYALFSKKN